MEARYAPQTQPQPGRESVRHAGCQPYRSTRYPHERGAFSTPAILPVDRPVRQPAMNCAFGGSIIRIRLEYTYVYACIHMCVCVCVFAYQPYRSIRYPHERDASSTPAIPLRDQPGRYALPGRGRFMILVPMLFYHQAILPIAPIAYGP